LRLEGFEHVAYERLSKVAGDAVDGGGVFLDEAAEVLGGLVLLMEGDGVVAVKGVTIMGGEQDFSGDGDEITGGLAAGGIVGEGSDGLGDDRTVEGGVGIGRAGVENAVVCAGVELADSSLGKCHLCVECLGLGGEDGDSEGADIAGNVRRGTGLMVAASGERKEEQQREKAESHASYLYCRIEENGEGGVAKGRESRIERRVRST